MQSPNSEYQHGKDKLQYQHQQPQPLKLPPLHHDHCLQQWMLQQLPMLLPQVDDIIDDGEF